MSSTLIANATIFDATGASPFPGAVLVEGSRIKSVMPGDRQPMPPADVVIDAGGRFLMPGMTEGHAHLSFEAVTATEDLIRPSPEEHTLLTARVAKVLIDHGFTSAYGASAAKLKLDVAVRNEVNAGRLPGPRIRAASLEITVTGGLGDESQDHNPRQGISAIVDGPEEMRKTVRRFCREGCDNIKLDVSGDPFYPNIPAHSTPMSLEEVKMAVETAHSFGRKVNAHARSKESVKRCVLAGVDAIFHAEFSDEETLDLLESAKDRIFVAPTVSLFHTMMHEASPFGITPEVCAAMTIPELIEESVKTHTALRKRGIRHLIGGDYGFAWSRQGGNARDLSLFMNYYGYSAEGALICATRNGGLAMRSEGDLGTLKPGMLADMLLVDGDPLEDVSILTDKGRIAMVMKDGAVHSLSPAIHVKSGGAP